MKRLVFFCLAVGAPLFASPEEDCRPFNVGLDLLYWKPCVDDLDFAAKLSGESSSLDNPLQVRYMSICPDWEPGLRVTLSRERAWQGFDLSLSYTLLKTADARSSHAGNGERIAPVLPHPLLTAEGGDAGSFNAFARGKWHTGYQTFDILFSYRCPLAFCQRITPFFGVELLNMDQEIKAKYIGLENGLNYITLVKWDSAYRGAGLKIGTDYSYTFCEGLSLFARASGSLLIGDAHTVNKQAVLPEDESGVIVEDAFQVDFKDRDCCRVVPGGHLKAGLQYEGVSCGCFYTLRIGYEMVAWANMQNPRRWFEYDFGSPEDTFEGLDMVSTQTNTTLIGFHGLFAGIDCRF